MSATLISATHSVSAQQALPMIEVGRVRKTVTHTQAPRPPRPVQAAPAVAAGPAQPSQRAPFVPSEQVLGYGSSGVVGYVARGTSTATKTNTPVIDIPQSVTILIKQQLEDRASFSVQQALTYVPGVTVTGGEGNKDAITIRGQNTTADFYRDGVRDDAEYYRDLYNIQAVEGLKGPSALTFGRGGGGIVNRVTKKADGETIRNLEATGGSFGRRRVTADVGQAINDQLAVRLNALYEQSDGYRNYFKMERYGVNPTLTWKPLDKTFVTLSYEHYHDRRFNDRGIPSFIENLPAGLAAECAAQHLAFAAALFAALGSAAAAPGDALVEPFVFNSRSGLLDLLIIAKPKPITAISFAPPRGAAVNPIGWDDEICPRPPAGDLCPAEPSTVADYGGARLALQPGDTLKIHFVNRLPRLDPAKVAHATDEGGANLSLNPSNIDTHGLIVPARAPTRGDPTFGDYVFVNVFNSRNITEQQSVAPGLHDHGQVAMDSVDYQLDIPKNHPSGLYWFHPHVHGLALNQVSSGLAGIITIGNVSDYAGGSSVGVRPAVRHLILKDLQVLTAGTHAFEKDSATVADGEVLNQQDPDFRAQSPAPGEVRQGSCPGANNSADEGNDYSGGKWYFTINGQQFPTIPVQAPQGEFWRLTNASGSLSSACNLCDTAADRHAARLRRRRQRQPAARHAD